LNGNPGSEPHAQIGQAGRQGPHAFLHLTESPPLVAIDHQVSIRLLADPFLEQSG
jgi:hypothetical protein